MSLGAYDARILIRVDRFMGGQMLPGEKRAGTVVTLSVWVLYIGMVRTDVLSEFAASLAVYLAQLTDQVVRFEGNTRGQLLQMDILFVVVQGVIAVKRLLAFGAHVWILALVHHLLVVAEIEQTSKVLAALLAGVRLFVCMQQHVPLEARFRCKCLITDVTRWNIYLTVGRSNVGCEFTLEPERFAARVAHVVRYSLGVIFYVMVLAMNFIFVYLQLQHGTVTQRTMTALVRPLVDVMATKVPIKCSNMWKVQIAFLTAVFCPPCMIFGKV